MTIAEAFIFSLFRKKQIPTIIFFPTIFSGVGKSAKHSHP